MYSNRNLKVLQNSYKNGNKQNEYIIFLFGKYYRNVKRLYK
jgi:hypothetical protein